VGCVEGKEGADIRVALQLMPHALRPHQSWSATCIKDAQSWARDFVGVKDCKLIGAMNRTALQPSVLRKTNPSFSQDYFA